MPPDHDMKALQSKIQEMLSNPAEAKRAHVEAATSLGIDLDALVANWASKNTSPFLEGPLPAEAMDSDDVSMPDVSSPMEDVTSAAETVFSPDHDALYDSGTPVEVLSSPVSDGFAVNQPRNKHKVKEVSSPVTDESTANSPTKVKENLDKNSKSKPRSFKAPSSPALASALPPSTDTVSRHHEENRKSRARKQEQKRLSASGPARMESTSMGTEPMVDHMPSLFVSQIDRYPVLPLPKWHVDLKDSNFQMKELAKKQPQAYKAIESLKNCIGRCEEVTQRTKFKHSSELAKLWEELRDHVHKAEIVLKIDKFIAKKSRILTAENGLPRIFGEDARFPSDLKADAYQLYLRWMREDFSLDLLRGIKTVKGANRGSDQLDAAYKKQHPTDARCYGDNGLVLGQWWPSQLCTLRDGAHGSSQGGIFGEKEKGTYSIVVSGGGAYGYKDEDDGDTIVYSGTEGSNFTPTEATLHMVTSADLKNEIRVIRSHRLAQKSKYRPTVGLRYDGLYTIESFNIVDKEKQIHIFKLSRCPGQEPIRCVGAASRPTKFEIEEYHKLKGRV
jgi:hypothetical protein